MTRGILHTIFYKTTLLYSIH